MSFSLNENEVMMRRYLTLNSMVPTVVKLWRNQIALHEVDANDKEQCCFLFAAHQIY